MSGIYAATSQELLTGAFNWASGAFAAMLVGPGYTPDYTNHAALSDVPSGARLLASPIALSGEAVVGGFCTAANISWVSLATSAAIEGLLIVQNTGTTDAPVWKLVCYIDQGDGFGQQATGGAVTVVFDARGIFRP